jgi:TonB family protein
MSEQKPCVRCERAIDGWARICPYCNWDQSRPAPVREVVPAPVAEYKPPAEKTLRQKAIYAGAGLLLLIVAFGIGMLINRDGAPKNVPESVIDEEAQTVSVPKRADTPLVPTNERGGFEAPITSAPVNDPAEGVAANEWDRSDATAVSSVEYAQLERRAQAEKKKSAGLVDPRTITGTAYNQAPRRRSPVTATGQVASLRTRPVPLSQPVPRLAARGSARLDLVIGPDGRVKDINVRRSISGNSAALIGAVQQWRFKPATANGRPVAAPYSVEISFRP